jgi:hypothetical protein
MPDRYVGCDDPMARFLDSLMDVRQITVVHDWYSIDRSRMKKPGSRRGTRTGLAQAPIAPIQ